MAVLAHRTASATWWPPRGFSLVIFALVVPNLVDPQPIAEDADGKGGRNAELTFGLSR